ncbi:MAG: lasso peptide biosynthesis B2 protein [Mariniphaga sp.]
MLTKFLSLPNDEKMLLIEAIVLLFISKIIVCFPFRHYIKLLRPVRYPQQESDLSLLIKIGKSIHRANKLAFWKNICLVKSVAARFILSWRGIPSVFSLGLFFNDRKELGAHAWVRSGYVYISPRGDSNFKEIFTI